MSKVNTILEDNIFLRYTVIILGMFIACIGINGFLRPAHLLSGGVPGIAAIINYTTDINIGLLTFLINMILFSILLGITQNIGKFIPVDDILLQTVFGGILSGVGSGMVFRTKSSQGGTDIIGAILKFKKNIEVKDTALATNLIIVSIGGAIFGINLALYTLIGYYISASVMSFVKDAMTYEKSVMVISKESEIIATEIMSTLVRGVTFLEAEGAYTKEKKRIIYCIVLSKEIPKIKEIVLKYDQKAFISVNDVSEVKGRGFKEKYL